MRIIHFSLLYVAVTLLGFAQGCEDGDDKVRQMLSGRWELVQAFRNEKATETLMGTYFVFTEEGKMETNLPVGSDAPVPFVLDKKTIEQQTPQPIKYTIQEISDTSLVLGLELRGVNFEMFLKRASSTVPPPDETETDPADTLYEEPDTTGTEQ